MATAGERHFTIRFGEDDDPQRGELVLYRPIGTLALRVELVVEGEEPPSNLHSKGALASARAASGLGLVMRPGWVEQDGHWIRECTLVGDNDASLAELLPPVVCS